MKNFHEICDLYPGDSRNRHKLKLRLQDKYGVKITFFQRNRQCVVVVLRTNNLAEVLNAMTDTDRCLKNVARRLRSDLLAYCEKIRENNWPPTIESVTEEYGKPPASVELFLSCVLKDNEVSKCQKGNTDNLSRLIDSFSADLVNAVSKGKVITPKNYLVGLGIHNMTGQKTPVQIMNKLGHSIGYNKVCEIETSLAELAIHISEEFNVLPLSPTGKEEIVPTFYWVDNFDVKVEKQIGGSGSVNTTHPMAFQEVPNTTEANITIRKQKIEFLWINQDLGFCQRNRKLRLRLHTKSILTRNHHNSTKIPHSVLISTSPLMKLSFSGLSSGILMQRIRWFQIFQAGY